MNLSPQILVARNLQRNLQGKGDEAEVVLAKSGFNSFQRRWAASDN